MNEPLKPKYPVDFTPDGDTTSQAIDKHIKELTSLYADLTDIYEKLEISKQETVDILSKINKMGTVVERDTGTSEGGVPVYEKNKLIDANIKGTAKTITDILEVGKGGTGVTSVQTLRSNMGLGNTLGVLPIGNGGTGAADSGNALRNLGGMIRPNSSTLIPFYSSNGVYSPNIHGTWAAFIIVNRYVTYDTGEGTSRTDLVGVSSTVKIGTANTLLYSGAGTCHGFFWKID